jgi:hypothetical protein
VTATGSLSQPSRSKVDQQWKPPAQNRGPRPRTELGHGHRGLLCIFVNRGNSHLCVLPFGPGLVRLVSDCRWLVVPAGGSTGLQATFVRSCRKQASTGRPEEEGVRPGCSSEPWNLAFLLVTFIYTSQPWCRLIRYRA